MKILKIFIFIILLLSIILISNQGVYRYINFNFQKQKVTKIIDSFEINNFSSYTGLKVFKRINLKSQSNGWISIKGPFPTDSNHIFPGIGPLHVLLFNELDFMQKRELNLSNTLISFEYISNIENVDRIKFWFQTKIGKRIVNYCSKKGINHFIKNNSGKAVVLEMNKLDFDCLGTSIVKRRVYGCDISSSEALRNINIDFGFIYLMDGKSINNFFFKIKNFKIFISE